MTIKIVFDSFDEMMGYADRLKNGTLFDQTGKLVDEETIVRPYQPETTAEGLASGNSIPYGRQIAPHFPNANVSQQLGAVSAAQNAIPSQPQAAPAAQQPAQAPVPAPQPAFQPQSTQTNPAAQQAAPLAAAPGAVPTAAHEYTQDDLARAAMQLMDKGGMQQLQQLLAGYGCETLQQLPKEQYGNFATALRGMGAQI